MRTLESSELGFVCGGDDDANSIACATSVSSTNAAIGLSTGLAGGVAASAMTPTTLAACESLTTAAAAEITIAAGDFTDSLSSAWSYFENTMSRGFVNWFNVDDT